MYNFVDVRKPRISLSPLLQIVKLHPQNLSGLQFPHLEKDDQVIRSLKLEDDQEGLFSTNSL